MSDSEYGNRLQEVRIEPSGLVRVQLSLSDPPHLLGWHKAEELGERIIEAALTIRRREEASERRDKAKARP
jgi:hypothetical protein